MTRFSKGTTDHDGDGHMGGSRKGDNAMAKGKKRAATKQDSFEAAAAASESAQKAKTAADGAKQKVQRMTRGDETAEAKKTLPAKREAAADQFAEADAAAVGDGELKLRMAALGGY